MIHITPGGRQGLLGRLPPPLPDLVEPGLLATFPLLVFVLAYAFVEAPQGQRLRARPAPTSDLLLVVVLLFGDDGTLAIGGIAQPRGEMPAALHGADRQTGRRGNRHLVVVLQIAVNLPQALLLRAQRAQAVADVAGSRIGAVLGQALDRVETLAPAHGQGASIRC